MLERVADEQPNLSRRIVQSLAGCHADTIVPPTIGNQRLMIGAGRP